MTHYYGSDLSGTSHSGVIRWSAEPEITLSVKFDCTVEHLPEIHDFVEEYNIPDNARIEVVGGKVIFRWSN